MSNFPNNFDDDTTLPFVNDNITEIGGDAINALRDAVFAIEQNIGLNAQGTTISIAARFGVAFNPDGTLKPSAITSLGLVTLPITNDQIADWAQIPERKLVLDHKTQDLFNYIRDLSGDVNLALGWISSTGIKLDPHIIGAIYRHTMDQIDVATTEGFFLSNNLRQLRNNQNSYTLVADINSELLAHQWADGSPFGNGLNITTNNGSVYSNFYAHMGSGIFINTSRFNNIPETADDVQLFAEYIDSSSIFLLGTRIQNLYTAGISRISRSSSLTTDGYGQFIIPPTAAIAYLKNIGNSSNPVDDINHGDDIIQFQPNLNDGYAFDEKFALVKVGDIIRINYGTIEVPFLIKEKKYSASGGAKTFIVRIAGKNIAYQPNAIARIDRPLFNNNKWGELSISPVSSPFAGTPSLIINNPRGAQALGLGFNPAQFDEKHYKLYLALYPTGHATDGYVILPGIDVTGNQGTTPGLYTLESIVQATNNAFRKVGFNYRFTAFSYQGEFGICLAESYGNAAFSILSVPLKADGTIDTLANQVAFPNNVLDMLPTVGTVAPDPLGIGPFGAAIASPPYYIAYGSSAASQNPTKLFIPLRRNNYYVNGAETERLALEPSQALDGYGDGYWVGTIFNVNVLPTRVETTYRIPLDLSTSGLKAGKTVVIQSLGTGTLNDFGRFIIESVSLGCCSPSNFTDIVVYDAVHAKGFSPIATLGIGNAVKVYFGADSVSFNAESATDTVAPSPATTFKRHFEVYVNADGNTFTHERGRMSLSTGAVTVNGVTLTGFSQIAKADIMRISPKLRGYQFGSVNKITFNVFSYSDTTGLYDGYLCSYNGTNMTHVGPRISGRKGEVTRFYDETGTDYIDIIWDINANVTAFTNQLSDIQLFPSLQLDDELLLLGTCQVDDSTHQVTRIQDARQFGNTSEKDLSSSVFEYLAAPERYLHSNGVIRGFDIANVFQNTTAVIDLAGGLVLVDGKIINVNNKTISIPLVQELYNFSLYRVDFALCINSKGDYETIVLQDYDTELNNVPFSPRVVTVQDLFSATTYSVPSVLYADLINRRRDLTILYIVSLDALTEGGGLLVSTVDARRYVQKKDWGERPTFNVDADNGEFRTFESLTTWLNFYSGYSSVINLKGVFNSAQLGGGTVTFNNPVLFKGDGTTTFSPGSFDLGFLKVGLENIILNVYAFEFNSAAMDNCIINFNPSSGGHATFFSCQVTNTTFNHTGSGGPLDFFAGSIIQNCTINLNSNSEALYIGNVFKGCTVNINGANCTITIDANARVENCTFNISANSVTWAVSGSMADCVVNYTTGTQLPITLSSASNSNFSFLGNKVLIPGGASSPSSILSVLDGSNGIIANNFFFRGGLSLSSGYILAPVTYTSGSVAVVDNFFDSTTADGSSQNLVKNLPLQWVYKNNINTPPTMLVRQITSGPYTVAAIDNVITVNSPGASITINLPQISLVPLGRTLTIKDLTGNFDNFPVTLHRAVVTETIENLTSDYVYQNPYGSLTLVAVSGGWIII